MFARYWRFIVIDEHICKRLAWPSRLRARKAICASTGSLPDQLYSIERDKFIRIHPSAFRVQKTVALSLGVLKNEVFDEEDEVIEPFDDLPTSPNVFPITSRGGELDATPALNPRSRPA